MIGLATVLDANRPLTLNFLSLVERGFVALHARKFDPWSGRTTGRTLNPHVANRHEAESPSDEKPEAERPARGEQRQSLTQHTLRGACRVAH